MGNKLRRIFAPTPEEEEEYRRFSEKLRNKLAKKKGCTTCSHCKHVIDYPGFVTAEECECEVGLECDTVLFSVKDCPSWDERKFTWERREDG